MMQISWTWYCTVKSWHDSVCWRLMGAKGTRASAPINLQSYFHVTILSMAHGTKRVKCIQGNSSRPYDPESVLVSPTETLCMYKACTNNGIQNNGQSFWGSLGVILQSISHECQYDYTMSWIFTIKTRWQCIPRSRLYFWRTYLIP